MSCGGVGRGVECEKHSKSNFLVDINFGSPLTTKLWSDYVMFEFQVCVLVCMVRISQYSNRTLCVFTVEPTVRYLSVNHFESFRECCWHCFFVGIVSAFDFEWLIAKLYVVYCSMFECKLLSVHKSTILCLPFCSNRVWASRPVFFFFYTVNRVNSLRAIFCALWVLIWNRFVVKNTKEATEGWAHCFASIF